MSQPDQDTRVIEQDAETYNATLVAREDIGPDLGYFRVKLDGPAVPFEPGQYMTIGVVADGKMLSGPIRSPPPPPSPGLTATSSSSATCRSSGSRRPCGGCRSASGCA